MKVNELIKKLYSAIRNGNQTLQKKLYEKITKKSLKKKHTQAVQ
jgi:hypothetical protein